MNHLYTAQEQSIEQEPAIQTDTVEKIATEEKSDLEKWNDHLNSLSENWDATKNVPSDTWLRPKAFDLATAVVKQNKDQAASVKSQFLDKINEVATKFTPDTLAIIKEFDSAIDAQTDSIESKPAEEKPIEQTTPEVAPSTPETINEPEQTSIQEAPALTSESASTTNTTTPSTESGATAAEEPKKDLETQWKEIIESIKNEKEISTEQLNKAAEIARDRVVLNQYPQEMLERDLFTALSSKSQGVIDAAMNQFKITLAYGSQPNSYPSYASAISPKELEMHLDAKMRAEKEKQDQKYREAIEALAAAKKLQEEGKLSEAKVHTLAQQVTNMDLAMKKKEAEWQQQAQEASQRYAEMMKQQMAKAQKAQSNAGKGVFSRFTEAVGNWWYGKEESPNKPIQLSADDQKNLLNQIVHNARDKKGAKKAFTVFQQTILDFSAIKNEAEYNNWVKKMQQLFEDIVITHKIMGLTELSSIVRKTLLASENIKPEKIQNILDAISSEVRKTQAREAEKKAQDEEERRQEQEVKEQKIAALQKIKDEEIRKKTAEEAEQKRIIAEQQKRVVAASDYKDQKKQWYALLDRVAQHKGAVLNNHKEYTQEALKKSHSLLQLANDIPHKNKTSISQKLKQKFSLALLEQQKNNNDDAANIHHYMDVFNNEINKMVD